MTIRAGCSRARLSSSISLRRSRKRSTLRSLSRTLGTRTAMIARFLDGLEPKEEHIRRWTILIIGFGGCRAEAALEEAGPFQLDTNHHLIRLNPYGRRQSKKYRPTIPVAE